MKRDSQRTYVQDCKICREAERLYLRTGSDYDVMKDHPACQKCGALIGSAHATRSGPICSSCVGMPGPTLRVADSLKMAEQGRRSLSSYAAGVGRTGER